MTIGLVHGEFLFGITPEKLKIHHEFRSVKNEGLTPILFYSLDIFRMNDPVSLRFGTLLASKVGYNIGENEKRENYNGTREGKKTAKCLVQVLSQ